MKLYTGPLSMFGAKAEIALREKAVNCEIIMVPFHMQKLYEPKHPEVLRVNPKRQVPVLIDGDVEIFDSTQIFEYLEDRWPSPPLWPRAPAERARARLLELKSDEVYFPPIIRLMGLQSTPQDPAAIAAREAAHASYLDFEKVLAGNEFLAGPLTYADIAFYMAQLFGARMGAPMGTDTPRLLAWRDRMTARPAVARVAGTMGRFLEGEGRPIPDFLRPALAASGR
ncbi:MAG: glutathione S-transferase family protein [Steroidobacteraceae bacterium]